MMNCYCTLFDKNYLSRGVVMLRSLHKYTPPCLVYVLALDDETVEAVLEENVAVVVRLEDALETGLFKRDSRSWQEYCWTLGSQFLEWTTKHCFSDPANAKQVTYLDADLMFFSDPEIIFDEIGNQSIGIIPHRFNKRDEARLIQNGKFNVSWVTIKNTPTGRACIERWAKQCRDWCYYRNEDGKFGDQKYLDEWTELYPGEVCEISNPGAGLAPWNIARYDFIQNGNGLRIYRDRQTGLNYHCPVVFYHYHEFQQREDGSYRLTNYPLSQSAKDLIYAPYIEALKAVEAIHIPA